jgi:hypothetical protein
MQAKAMLRALAFLFNAWHKNIIDTLNIFMEQGNLPGAQNTSGANEPKSENERKLQQQKVLTKNDSDTEPDEFIAPNADTDQPLDGKGIVNDAVLGGEDHTDIDVDKKLNENKQ